MWYKIGGLNYFSSLMLHYKSLKIFKLKQKIQVSTKYLRKK